MGPFRNPVKRSWGQDDVLQEDGEGLSVIQNSLVSGAQAGPNDPGEVHPAQEVVEDGMSTDEMHTMNSGPLICNDAASVADLSCIHLLNSV